MKPGLDCARMMMVELEQRAGLVSSRGGDWGQRLFLGVVVSVGWQMGG
jgi:hypothetical protein